MIDTSLLFSPLLNHVCDEDECFSNYSSEYSELLLRLKRIHSYVNSVEVALRLIARTASEKGQSRRALEEILHMAFDHVGLAKLAALMLDDINCCLAYTEASSILESPEELDAELNRLLGEPTTD